MYSNSEISQMEIEIISFGKISEIIGNQKIEVSGFNHTDELKAYLEEAYPLLENIKFKFALNNKFVQENTLISDGDTVAIMPPFSGG